MVQSPRRSRRAGGSSSASKSPDNIEIDGEYISRAKRMKHEEDPDDEPVIPQSRGRRKKEKLIAGLTDAVAAENDQDDLGVEDEEQGVTRCICGEENDPGEFMVMCEQCTVWQHGFCVGFHIESDVPEDYFCEQCKPELHTQTMQDWQLKRRGRQPSSSHQPNGNARLSRSHSPNVGLKQASKRRNTMNSRDADFDEVTRQVMEASAAEAEGRDSVVPYSNGHPNGLDDEQDPTHTTTSRKKRRRMDDDIPPTTKRTRSISTASENPLSAVLNRGETPVMLPSNNSSNNNSTNSRHPVPILGPPPKAGAKGKRGGNKKNPSPPEPRPTPDAEEATSPQQQQAPQRRSGWGGRGRGGNRKPVTFNTAQLQDNPRGKGASNGPNAPIGDSSKHGRNSHAYVVSQQALYTSWNLPDYLAHLEQLLPSEFPEALTVPCGGENGEVSVERGVKIKWPSKRMSVVDMNKRVRSLVEWVGREQASALDRDRRKLALEKAIMLETPSENGYGSMLVDGGSYIQSPDEQTSSLPSRTADVPQSTGTMKLMEELMEELIRFQERFGPGRGRERDKVRGIPS